MSKPGLKAVDANINPEAVEGAANPDAVAEKPDPFDPANLRLSQSFAETVGVKKLLTTVPVANPTRKILCGFTLVPSIARTSRSSS